MDPLCPPWYKIAHVVHIIEYEILKNTHQKLVCAVYMFLDTENKISLEQRKTNKVRYVTSSTPKVTSREWLDSQRR